MNDQELYGAIFDIVEQNMQKAGKTWELERACCVESASGTPGEADVLRLSYEEDNLLFLKKAYLMMLGRAVDPAALEAWKERAGLPREEFQAAVVNGLKESQEFFQAQIRLTNNIYADPSTYPGTPVSAGSGITLPERLLRVYRKMPVPLRNAAKKILGAR